MKGLELNFKRKLLLTLLLALVLCSSALAETPIYSGGDGSLENPFLISSFQDLEELAHYSDHFDKHFLQIDDIDASETQMTDYNDGKGWLPIGIFRGSYDGDGHTIDGLFIDRKEEYNTSFFLSLSGATIRNLGLTNTNIKGYYFVGSLAGASSNSKINNCYSTGIIEGEQWAGGLIGDLKSNSIVKNCNSSGTVLGDNRIGGLIGEVWNSHVINSHSNCEVMGVNMLGGLVGLATEESSIKDSYSKGFVKGEGRGVGGLLGRAQDQEQDKRLLIKNSHNTGNVTGSQNSSRIGGLVGGFRTGNIEQSYSDGNVTGGGSVGGLVGYFGSRGTIKNSYSAGTVKGHSGVGGLVGGFTSGKISQSHSEIKVEGYGRVGGFVGRSSGVITECYSAGTVKGHSGVGGFVGRSVGSVDNSYSKVDVTGEETVGGFVGTMSSQSIINKSYSIGFVAGNTSSISVGGFVGTQQSGTISNSFWDVNTSNQSTSMFDATGKSTYEMKNVSTFTDISKSEGLDVAWDFDTTWTINEFDNDGYPQLLWIYDEKSNGDENDEDNGGISNGNGNDKDVGNDDVGSNNNSSSNGGGCFIFTMLE